MANINFGIFCIAYKIYYTTKNCEKQFFVLILKCINCVEKE